MVRCLQQTYLFVVFVLKNATKIALRRNAEQKSGIATAK